MRTMFKCLNCGKIEMKKSGAQIYCKSCSKERDRARKRIKGRRKRILNTRYISRKELEDIALNYLNKLDNGNLERTKETTKFK